MKKIVLLFFLMFLVAALPAQTFDPNVNISGNNLNSREERILDELKNTMEQYIYANSFSNERYDFTIPYRINIFVTQISQSGSKIVISTNAFFSNEYDQRYVDNAWTFEYSEGEALYREMIYHPLRDIIDYYGYVIMATEMDGIEELGGNSLFALASEIYSRGSNSQWSKGWTERKRDLDKLTGDFRLRKARYLYNQAFWAIDEGKGTEGWYYLEEALKNLFESKRLDSQNKFLNFFIEQHYQDSEYFTRVYQDPGLLPYYRALAPQHEAFFDNVEMNYAE
jgi:hypothetical protein